MASYDCIVIGSGPGGYVAAIRAAQLGMKVAVVEKDKVGGRCLNYACIPAKAVLRTADVLQEIRDAGDFGLKVADPEVDYPAVMERRAKVIKTLTGGVAGLFKKNKIELLEGAGALTGDGKVRVGDDEHEASKCVILATGSVPKPIPGTEFGGHIIGTEQAWALEEMPGSLAVVGAGASGTEIASAYVRMGADVVLLEMLDRVLPAEDAEISKVAERGFKKQGIKVVTGTPVENVEAGDSKVKFTYGGESAEGDWLRVAGGGGPHLVGAGPRRASSEGLALADAGIERLDNGLIKVDGALKTSREGVYAIGDLVPGPALAHKASDEGIIAVEDDAGEQTPPIEYDKIPRATFRPPNPGA